MSENNKSYRIRTNVGSEYNGELNLNMNLLQDYDEFEILSLKIGTENLYKYHTSKYGCVVGRVLANGGIGVPNVKISSFIPVEDIDTTDPVFSFLYPYSSTRNKNRDDIRYNLLTDTKIDDCHQAIGTFPNKRLVLDDNNVIEIYDKYYKFTTTTNGSGDYMLFGLPVGNNIIHTDLDLSDIGILSQKPRDLFYKGYTAKQFENASQFKKDTNLDNLTQVISQDSSIYVFPFWGDEIENEGQIKIVRNDIDVNYKFEPTCIFIGCIVSDEKSNAISKNCIPHERMGKMDRLTTGAGTIEMIRKTVSGDIESISIQGNNLIDGNGTWCYQIPMNLDYVSTDEYGNLVPTDDYNKGLPTRTSVRFRVSLADYESDYENAHLVKVLVPNNPEKNDNDTIDYDYEFGSATQDESFRDMFWNNVYTVKSYIPRFQKGNRQKNKNFTGFKAVNVNGSNNPIPYNNMRINLTFLFVLQCLIFKSLVLIVKTLNKIIAVLNALSCDATSSSKDFACMGDEGYVYLTLDGGMCPTLDGNYIAPGAPDRNKHSIITHTYKNVYGETYTIKPNIEFDGDPANYSGGNGTMPETPAVPYDSKSADGKNSDLDTGGPLLSTAYTPDDVSGEQDSETTETMKIYNKEDYFVKCVELQFAMEYEVIQFDFYNDWINGMIYIPRWFAEIKKNKDNAYYCGNTFTGYRKLTQQCAVSYGSNGEIEKSFSIGCRSDKKQHCHKRWGRKQVKIFGRNRGIVTAQKNSRGQYAYYLRPNEIITRSWKKGSLEVKANLFSTDIVLLGSVLDCNQYGIPKVNGYTSSSYKMPPPVAEIVSDTQEMNLVYIGNPKSYAIDSAVAWLNEQIKIYTDSVLTSEYTIVQCDYSAKTEDAQNKLQKIVRLVKNDDEFVGVIGQKLKYSYVLSFFNSLQTKDDKIDLPENINAKVSDAGTGETGTAIAKAILTAVTGRCNECIDKIINFNNGIQNNGECVEGYYPMFRSLSYSINNEIRGKVSGNNIQQSAATIYENAYDYATSFSTISLDHFFVFEKRTVDKVQLDDESETTYSELSGIDWGYNPFTVGDSDDTTTLLGQVAGHFLEIGCTFSLSNIKSCVNLQRVCEIGGEISQSHYYHDTKSNTWNLLDPSGIIAKREISDVGIRGTFATLNSENLGVIYDTTNGYKKYIFTPYSPVSFMGDLQKRLPDGLTQSVTKYIGYPMYNNYGLIENQSLSYKAFRFGTTGDITEKFLWSNDENNKFFMPQYENSFYFYFGLKDGNTAIDRLYNEYYAPCNTNNGVPFASLMVEEDYSATDYRFKIRYTTENMGYLKWITVKKVEENGEIQKKKINDDWKKDTKKSIIWIKDAGKYIITFKDNRGQMVRGIVTCKHVDTKFITYTMAPGPDEEDEKITINWDSIYGIEIDSVIGDISDSTITDDGLSGSFNIEKDKKYVIRFKKGNGDTVEKVTICTNESNNCEEQNNSK